MKWRISSKKARVAHALSLALLSDMSTEMHTHHDQSDDARAANTAAPIRPASALRITFTGISDSIPSSGGLVHVDDSLPGQVESQ